MRIFLLALLAMFLSLPPAHAEEFVATVIGISDGDTITILHDGKESNIRLAAIDCPEKTQAFGTTAKHYTASLCFKKQVVVRTLSKDRYKRTIADVNLQDGRNLNEELVKAGFAWWYRKYAPFDLGLEILEIKAKEKRVGLWTDPSPMEPWNFRKLGKLTTSKK